MSPFYAWRQVKLIIAFITLLIQFTYEEFLVHEVSKEEHNEHCESYGWSFTLYIAEKAVMLVHLSVIVELF